MIVAILTLCWNCHQKHVELRALTGLPPEDRPVDRARALQNVFGRLGRRGILIEIKNRTSCTLRTERHIINFSNASLPGGLPEQIPNEANRIFYFKIPHDFMQRALTALTCGTLSIFQRNFKFVTLILIQQESQPAQHFLLGVSLGTEGIECFLQTVDRVDDEYLVQFESDLAKIRLIKNFENWTKNAHLSLANIKISTRTETWANNQKRLIFEITPRPTVESRARQAEENPSTRLARHGLFTTIIPDNRPYD